MTIPACSSCRSLPYCTKNNVGFGTDKCRARMNCTPKRERKKEPKPEPAPVEKSFVEEGLEAITQFGKKVGDFFDI